MERKTKRMRLAALLLAAVLAFGLTGCESLKDSVANMLGYSSAEEVDTTNWAEATTDPIMLPEGTDATAQWTNVVANGTLYGVYNGIWSRNTGYFQVSGDSLTITACGTAEGRPGVQDRPVEKGGRRGPVCGRLHRLYPHRRLQLPVHHRAGWTRRPSTA